MPQKNLSISKLSIVLSTLIAAPFFALSAHCGELDPLLTQIVERQNAALHRYTTYEYSVTTTGHSTFGGNDEKIDSQWDVIRKGDSFWATRRVLSTIVHEDDPTPRGQEVLTSRFVANPDYFANWMRANVPSVQIHYRKDWSSKTQQTELNRRIDSMTGPDPFEVAWSISENGLTVGDLLKNERTFSEDERPTWTVQPYTEAGGGRELLLKRCPAKTTQPDLMVVVDPDKDYVVTQVKSFPDKGDTPFRIVKRSYEQIDGVWLLNRLEYSESEPEELEEQYVSVYKIRKLGSDAPADRFTLAGLSLPERVALSKITPSAKSPGKAEHYEYKNGEIIPLKTIEEDLKLQVELGILPPNVLNKAPEH
ncbi:MAG: hypothetical protein K1Y02_15620 [Candidatus Hydrogenedentes bacterium]|nr:hypothetical protein [Candidatus Hydrogenedentota bacterium]